MRRFAINILIATLGAFLLWGCKERPEEAEKKKWEIKPEKDNKRPYGTYLAHQSLQYYFPEAKLETLPGKFRYTNMDQSMIYGEGKSLLVLQGLNFYVAEDEWTDLKRFIRSGNEVILFCTSLDSKIEEEVGCEKEHRNTEEYYEFDEKEQKSNKAILTLENSPGRYGYYGRSLKGYFSFKTDTAVADTEATTTYFDTHSDTLGYAAGKPNFVRYKLGEGHLTIHAAPLVLSNYFLLQDNNEQYLSGVWHTLPGDIKRIYWNDYMRRTVESSGLSVLFKYPATRLAMILALAAMALYVLFEGKRKQRIIPIIPSLKNDSVSFVETVGRLYYNKGNHSNMALKMVQQFLEWVRTHYFLNTNLLNDDFKRQLINKSGQSEAMVTGLMEMIHEIRIGTAPIDDAYLFQFYNTIQLFYKKNRK